MTKKCKLEEMAKLLKGIDSFVVCAHVSPDGDALGSVLALTLALKKLGKRVVAAIADAVPDTYAFLPGIDTIINPAADTVLEADCLLVLDASSVDRIGDLAQIVKAKQVLNIDHHLSNTDFADYLYLDVQAAATGEILCSLIKSMDVPFDKDMAVCLYTAIYTDCGSFRYSNTTAATMHAAAELLQYGVEPNKISDAIEMNSRANIELLAKVLQTLSFEKDGAIAYISIPNEWYDKNIDTDNFVSYPRYIKNVEVAVLFKEVLPGVTRVSMRSSDINVADIAVSFGGGGHMRAAGCTINEPLSQARELLLKAVREHL